MSRIRKEAKNKRKFLPVDLEINNWKDIEPYAIQLLDFLLNTVPDLTIWLNKRSEFDSFMEEEKAWLYIRQSCHTDNEEYVRAFVTFVKEIDEPFALLTNKLNNKFLTFCNSHTYPKEYDIFLRGVRRQTEIFCEENIQLLADLEIEEQKYSAIIGAMTIQFENKEMTLQHAQNILKSTDRKIRQKAFELISERRSLDHSSLDGLFSRLLQKRQQVAANAGFPNYLEYRFSQLNRFDYTITDCETFHQAVAEHVVPLCDTIKLERKKSLQLSKLKPYDLDVDPKLKPPLKPFSSADELISKTISCFREIDDEFGGFIHTMYENGYLDLESHKGKAPGGYNYPLHESNVPFVFMNSTNNLRDLETMMHEGGHAIHSFLSKSLPLVYYKELPAEIAEVASMSMELISMEHWHHFFPDEEDLKQAKKSQLEGIIQVLPWVAAIDAFQHWLYTHPGHTEDEREKNWLSIEKRFSSHHIDWEGYEHYRNLLWQKQIHLFQFPLYYIEYGIAQLGAIAIWKNYFEDRRKTIEQYKKALSLGYSRTLPELYKAAGIRFDFSKEYICELMDFVRFELERLA